MIWTDETVEELKKMWDRGMTTGQIAKALNVTKNSIIGKVHRLCLTARPSPIKKNPHLTKETKEVTKEVQTTKSEPKKAVCEAPQKQTKEIVKNKQSISTPTAHPCNVPLVKLDNHSCRWPLGDPRDDDFCFCGKKIKTGQTYCEEHAAIAYVKPGKKI